MSADGRANDCSNPEALEVLVYRGNNTFTLYEDDGETLSYQNGEYLKTAFSVAENGRNVSFRIAKSEGTSTVVPENRTYILKFRDVVEGKVSVTVDGAKADAESLTADGTLVVKVSASPASTVEISVDDCRYLENADEKQLLINTIAKFQMGNDRKGMLFTGFLKNGKKLPSVNKDFAEPIEEILNLHR